MDYGSIVFHELIRYYFMFLVESINVLDCGLLRYQEKYLFQSLSNFLSLVSLSPSPIHLFSSLNSTTFSPLSMSISTSKMGVPTMVLSSRAPPPMAASIPFTDLEPQIHTFADLKTAIIARFDILEAQILQSINLQANIFQTIKSECSRLSSECSRLSSASRSISPPSQLFSDSSGRSPTENPTAPPPKQSVAKNAAGSLIFSPAISAPSSHGFLDGYVFFDPFAAAFDLEDKIVLVGEGNVGIGNQRFGVKPTSESLAQEGRIGSPNVYVFDSMD